MAENTRIMPGVGKQHRAGFKAGQNRPVRARQTTRKQATLADLEQIEPELLTSYTYYFRSIWQDITPAGQAALRALAHGEPVPLEKETRRWLRRRLLIDEDGQLLVPLFGRWIRDKEEMV
jgi:hypothetical protein